MQVHVDQITEMAAVMRKAIEIDEQQGCKEQERIFQLEVGFKLWKNEYIIFKLVNSKNN